MENYYLILIFIFYIVLFKIQVQNKIPKHKLCLDNIESSLKTGDLIFFRSNRNASIMDYLFYQCRTELHRYPWSPKCEGCPWGHIGIIYRPENNLSEKSYVIEFRHEGDNLCMDKNFGCQMVETNYLLKEYQRKNSGHYAVRHCLTNLDSEKILNIYKYCRNFKFRSFVKIILARLIPEKMHFKSLRNSDEMMCSEFIAFLMIQMGILKETVERSYMYLPRNFLPKNDIKNFYKKEYQYGPLIQFNAYHSF